MSGPAGQPTPGAANAAARGAGQDAGPGAADSTTMGCQLLRIGVFFDGTGNSRAHVPVFGTTWHTNVDLLEEVYQEESGVKEVDGERREVQSFSVYMRGIGVKSGGSDSWAGMGHGTGPEGVETRVAQAMDQIRQDIRTKASGIEPCDLWFDTFGFSRGATAARDFANGVKDGEITHATATLRVKYMGLFDTVSSMGEGGHTGNHEGVTLDTRGSVAEKIHHITAKDEIRRYFPLTRAYGETTVQVVGAHSDIGGGYLEGNSTSTFTYTDNEYPNVLQFYLDRWGVSANVTRPGDNDSVVSSGSDGRFFDTREVTITNTASHGLQFVTLNLMYDNAKAAGVPFAPTLPGTIAGKNVTMDANLQAYYEAIRDGTLQPEQEQAIRRQYAHFSVSYDGIVNAHLPEPSGRRRVARM